jgi:hypothetical protein
MMKVLLFKLLVLSLIAVGCDNVNNRGLNTRTDDSNIQKQETPADYSQGTSTHLNDMQREEDVTSGHLNSGTSDMEKSENMTTGAGATGSDLGTNRGAGSAAGSSDEAGMGMDE